MKAAYLHLLSDMLTSVAVLIGGLLMKFFQIYWLDGVLTIIISLYLLFMSWHIFRDSLYILMLFTPKHIKIEEIQKEVIKIDGVKNMHHVHIWQLNDSELHFDAHIEFKKDISLSEFDIKCKEIEKVLSEKFDIHHSFLQPEYARNDKKELIIQD